MRRALLSVAVGLAGAAAVTASGWAVEATALPPLVAVVSIADHEATARLYLYPVTRGVLARFHLLRKAGPRARR